jgi:hypothetical protein
MNRHQIIFFVLTSGALLGAIAAAAAQTDTGSLDRVRFVGRAAFNLKGGFKDVGSFVANPGARTTPDGDPYNYDDGYVLTDVSGNAGGQTWYWGYDSASQISGDTILMHRATVTGSTSSGAGTSSDSSLGFELVYDRKLGRYEQFDYGVEVAMNYVGVSLPGYNQGSANLTQTTDTYGFTPGTTPPGAPYQGDFNGPGFLINAVPFSSISTPGTATIVGNSKLDADVWAWRLGPYVDYSVTERLQLSFSAGLAMAVFSVSGSWAETMVISGQPPISAAGAGSDTALQWGVYLGLNASWQWRPQWGATIGLQYQYLDTYEEAIGGRAVELDLGKSIAVTFGVSYSF